MLYLGGAAEPFKNRRACLDWFQSFSELGLIGTVDSTVISTVKKDAPNVSHLQRALRRIDREWTKYDGFVVTLPYDEYLYYANILSYMIGESVEKPVIWATSLHFRDFEDRPDMLDVQLMTNILNATVIASSGVAASAVVGGNEIVSAMHARLDIIDDKDILRSVDGSLVGRLEFGVRLSDNVRMGDGARPIFDLEIDQKVERLHMDENPTDALARLRSFDGSGVIVDGGERLDLSILKQVDEETPALFVSGETVVLRESAQMHTIEHLTPESAAAKFLWLFGREGGSMHGRMMRNMIGESLLSAGV